MCSLLSPWPRVRPTPCKPLPGNPDGSYSTNGFTDIFVVTNNSAPGSITNYLDLGALTNSPTRYYRARLSP